MGNTKELLDYFIGVGEVKGYEFRKVLYDGYSYIYEVRGGSDRVYYEVFERRVNDRFGVVSYPKSRAFGKWAFTTYDRAKADLYFKMCGDAVRRREG